MTHSSLIKNILQQWKVLATELTQRQNVPPATDGQQIEVLQVPLVPLEVREEHKPSVGVRIPVDDAFLLLPPFQYVVHPLEGGRGRKRERSGRKREEEGEGGREGERERERGREGVGGGGRVRERMNNGARQETFKCERGVKERE